MSSSPPEWKQTRDDPDDPLRRVGLDEEADRPVGEYSKGMRQRLGIALALVGEPDLLILDEPLSGLDPTGARIVRRVVRAERDRGATVFLSSHIMGQVETLCDRIGITSGGEIVACGSVAELRRAFDADEPVTVSACNVSNTAELRRIDGVRAVERSDDTVRIDCDRMQTVGRVVAEIDSVGGELQNLNTDGSSLEGLFLAAVNDDTGKPREKVVT